MSNILLAGALLITVSLVAILIATMRGTSNYGFTYGLVSALSSKLLTYADYEGLIEARGVEEVVSSLSDYPELKEASDIGGMELALYRNLQSTYTDILSTLKDGKQVEEAFLLEWDARNLKTIFRGIQSGLPEEDIINLIIPIGTLPLPYVNSLCASGGAEEVLGKLREDWANSIREYVGGGLEYTLAVDRWLVGIWKDLPYDFVKIRIDVLNIEIIARCQLSDIDASPFILEGGKFLDAKRLHQMVAAEDERAMFGMLARTPFEDISEAKSIKRFLHDIELKLLKDSSLSKPFSVEAAVSYLRAKEVEINNIMTILISKVQPVENIRGVLVYL